MKIKKYRPFEFLHMDEQAKWLADMARQGWHYKGGDWLGFQHFEESAPAEMAFCWDLPPRSKENALIYRKRCREAGWEMASTSGRWICWSTVVVPGQPVQPVRDNAETKAMLLTRQRQLSAQWMLMVVVLFLQLPNLFGKVRPLWLNLAMTACALLGAITYLREATYARARVRQLDAAGPTEP